MSADTRPDWRQTLLAHASMLAWPRLRPRLTTLIYHRVLPEPDPLRPGEVDAECFANQLRWLASHFELLTISEAQAALAQGRLPRRAACITFDDGYADNLLVAHPLLAAQGARATIFVATGYLDGGRMFSDSVIEFVRRVPDGVLDVQALEMGRHELRSTADRLAAISALQVALKYLPPQQRETKLRELLRAVPVAPLPDDLMLSSAQVAELARLGHEIGGHTVDHTVLTTLPLAQAREQVEAGLARLQQITGRRPSSFAYPNGRPQRDYQGPHVQMLRELGLQAAVSTSPGVALAGDDPHQLPRYTPWGRDLGGFALRMMRNAWQGGPALLA